MIENLACTALAKSNHMNVPQAIKEWQQCKQISPKQSYDLRQKIEQLQTKSYEIALSELDQKINRVAERYK